MRVSTKLEGLNFIKSRALIFNKERENDLWKTFK